VLTERELRGMLAEIEKDDRLYYEVANVLVNAPLALEQVANKSRAQLLRRILGLPHKQYHGRDEMDPRMEDVLEMSDEESPFGVVVRCQPDDQSRAYYGCVIVDLSPAGLEAVKEGRVTEGMGVVAVPDADERCSGCQAFPNPNNETMGCFCDSIVKRGKDEDEE